MPDQTVPTDTGELTGYAATAAELRRIANALDTLPPGAPAYVTFGIQTNPRTGTRAQIESGVDVVAMAVLGEPGKTKHMSGNSWHHGADRSGSFNIDIYQAVPDPNDERDAELERLRAEVATLRSADYGHDRIDHGDATTPVPATVDGHAEFTGRATVPNGGGE